jgi:2-oxoglutarate ferredoxin oxidoreductase subunit delta
VPKKGEAIIEIKEEWCKGCAFCVEFCPQNVLTMSGVYPEVVKLEDCTSCGICEVMCPDFAIIVTTKPKPVTQES